MPAPSASAALADKLRASLHELRAASGDYGHLIRHIESNLHGVERGEVDVLALKEAQTASLSYPRLQPLRAAAATDDGLEATRALLIEIKNRVVSFEQEAERAKGGSGADPKPGSGS